MESVLSIFVRVFVVMVAGVENVFVAEADDGVVGHGIAS